MYNNFYEALKGALKNDINIDLKDVNNSAHFNHPFWDVYTKKSGKSKVSGFTQIQSLTM